VPTEHTSTLQDSVILEYEAATMANTIPAFRGNRLPSSPRVRRSYFLT